MDKYTFNAIIMKKCPTCDQMCPDDAIFCRQCGEKFPETEKGSSVGISEGNTFTGGVHMNDVHSDSDGRDDMDAPNSDVNISGDDNVTYVSKTTNKTNSDNVHKTNSDNTTINNYWPQKSKGELQEEDLLRYRLKCKEFYKNGLISKDAEEQLHELQVKLCLADELVLPIKKEIQQMSRVPSTELSLGVIAGINNTKSIIERNSSDAIRRHLRQLESWMQVYDDDSLRSWCCQLSSMLDPVQFTERFEQSAKDEYWHRYWAHIAYMLQNKEEQAYEASSCLGLLQANHPEHDEVLLLLVGRLIQNEPIESIENEFNTGALFCSQELQLLCDTINELLHKKWSQLWDVIPGTFQVRWSGKPEVRPAHSFYANNLFKSFVNTQIEAGKKQREEEERMSRAERQRQEEITQQKGFLLNAFQESEDIEKACAELNIPYFTFKSWKEEDSSFNLKYNAIVRRIEEKKNEEAENEAKISQQKSLFISLYRQNDSDFIKTCSEIGIGSDTVKIWRGSDKAFDDGLTIIEREHKRKLQELFIQFYEANGCDVRKSCAETGISEEEYNDWRKSDKSFAEVLFAIEREHIKELKDAFIECYGSNYNVLSSCKEVGLSPDDIRVWRKQDEAFNNILQGIEQKRNNELKDAFVKCYGANNCDIQTACKEVGLSPDDIKTWRKEDSAFHNTLCDIERERRIKRFVSTILPCLLIVILISFIIWTISNRNTRVNNEKNQYKELLQNFNEVYSNISLNDEGVIFIEKAYEEFGKIKAYKDSLNIPSDDEFNTISETFCVKYNELIDYFVSKTMPTKGNLEEIKVESKKYQELIKRVRQMHVSIDGLRTAQIIDMDDFYAAVSIYEDGDYARALERFKSCKSTFGEKYDSNLGKWILLCNDKINEQNQEMQNAADRRRQRNNNGYVYVSPSTLNISGQTFDIAAAASSSLASQQYKCVDDLGQSLYSIHITANIGETRYIKEEDRTCSSIIVMVQTKNSISGVILNTDKITIPLESTEVVSVRKAYRKLQTEIENTIQKGLKK